VVGAAFLGKYQVERDLGQGPLGPAWLAQHRALGKAVVIQQLAPARAALHDLRTLTHLEHPSVRRVYDLAQAGGGWFLVAEQVEGGSLEERLAKGGYRLREATPVMLGVLGGLAYLHGQGVVHHDLRPASILLTREGRAKLVDVGLGGQGPPIYRAPEQLEGKPGDARSDLYAAAAIFHHMLSGRHYLGEKAPEDLAGLRERVKAPVPKLPPSLVPSGVGAWLAKGLAKDPAQRFQSAEEMAKALQRALGP
jgi:serine/threonine-protein kinase